MQPRILLAGGASVAEQHLVLVRSHQHAAHLAVRCCQPEREGAASSAGKAQQAHVQMACLGLQAFLMTTAASLVCSAPAQARIDAWDPRRHFRSKMRRRGSAKLPSHKVRLARRYGQGLACAHDTSS